jgi:signal transduction histidine kinase
MKQMKILLVDDHEFVRKSLKQVLELHSQFDVVGEASNGAEAVDRVNELNPDIVLMDMNMPEMSGPEAIRVIKDDHPEIKVLALTAFADMSLVSETVKAGASGYLLKGGSARELIDALDAVARGQGALDKEVARGVMEDMAVLYQREQERANALAELDRMKREFISVVSHELRTPLTSIKGGAATLLSSWDAIEAETRAELLRSIERQAEHLGRMMTRIMVVSGIQRGGFGFTPAAFSLAQLAHEALEVFTSRAADRDVRLQLEDIQTSGDRERIKEVAVALIENALQFTNGSVLIRSFARGDRAILEVSDEGPGLDESLLKRLLQEPFTQADSSDTRSTGGLGLSLYLARQVLEASDGTLEVDTAPDRGSTFSMVLPLSGHA